MGETLTKNNFQENTKLRIKLSFKNSTYKNSSVFFSIQRDVQQGSNHKLTKNKVKQVTL